MHALLEDKLKKESITGWYVDSCGTEESFAGAFVDQKVSRELKKRGIDFSHTARPFEPSDYSTFDYIFVISWQMANELRDRAPDGMKEKILPASHFVKNGKDQPIPDPYSRTENGVQEVITFIDTCVEGIFETLIKPHVSR